MKKGGKKIIVILGPTASGKSDLAVGLAKKFNGEIISADSRQVYKEMDIGTGKVEGTWQSHPKKNRRSSKILKMQRKKVFMYKGIPHYCIDYVSPKRIYTVLDFKKCAEKAIKDILSRGKIPIICGGTGFYIQAITGGIAIPEVKPNWKLRKQLEKKTAEQLFKMLKKLDPERAKTIDAKNPRRLIRAIELAQSLDRVPRTTLGISKGSPWQILQIGIKLPKKELEKKIEKRVKKMINPPSGEGLIEETKKLKKSGLPWKRIYELGFEYKYPAMFLRGKISKEETLEKMFLENRRYAKRQITWFKKYPKSPDKSGHRDGGSQKIRWMKNYKEAERLAKKFLQFQ